MDRFTSFVTGHAKAIVITTFALAVICVFGALLVKVNYDLASYLPESSPSSIALTVMEGAFDTEVPNASVMIEDVSLAEALEYKDQLAAIDGVSSVLWLDDVTDLAIPLDTQDTSLVEDYYKDRKALFSLTIDSNLKTEAMADIYELIGDRGYASGQAVSDAETQLMAGSEVANAFAILIPLILALLILSTNSWLEPLFFLLAIGISILFNMGTNVFLGEVSNIANTIAPILQLAVSLDYAIFLLHAFQRAREKESNVTEAMRVAMRESFSSIAASAATTVFGFAALGFMQFRIGADLGITLVKGIIFSFACVIIFLPAFTLVAYKLVDRTKHRPLMPSFRTIGKYLAPIRIPMVVAVVVLIVPCFLAQSHMTFTYGMGSTTDAVTRAANDTRTINATFGESTPVVVLVPEGDIGRELAFTQALEEDPLVDSVVSYPNAVGANIPTGFLDSSITEQFYGGGFARIIVYTNTATEGTAAFRAVENIRNTAASYYGNSAYVAGEPPSLYDMKEVTSLDSRVTNAIAIVAILLVLIITFRSALLPIILVATIESAIMINLAIPYFTGDSLNYLGFLVINTVQLGATVDYAILFTDTYLKNRRTMSAKEAIFVTSGSTFKSILVSASILALAGMVLWLTSTNPVISILGLLLFRGTLLSLLMVMTFLPAVLRLLDRPIELSTWHAAFYHAPDKKPNEQAASNPMLSANEVHPDPMSVSYDGSNEPETVV